MTRSRKSRQSSPSRHVPMALYSYQSNLILYIEPPCLPVRNSSERNCRKFYRKECWTWLARPDRTTEPRRRRTEHTWTEAPPSHIAEAVAGHHPCDLRRQMPRRWTRQRQWECQRTAPDSWPRPRRTPRTRTSPCLQRWLKLTIIFRSCELFFNGNDNTASLLGDCCAPDVSFSASAVKIPRVKS